MSSKRVLVTVLDWGLGHATRCVPIIRELLQQDCTVLIAGSGDSLLLLKQEFPELLSFRLPGYQPQYSAGSSQVFKMLGQVIKFITVIKREHKKIDKIICEHNIDLVISDNRYGCWSDKATSVFITHQVKILLPSAIKWMENMVNSFNRKMIRKYDHCWVPDFPGEDNLAGVLAHDHNIKVNYIGLLTRFVPPQVVNEKKYDILAILSGPEPQRSLLEEKLLPQLKRLNKKVLFVRGLVADMTSTQNDCVCVVGYLESNKLQEAILQSEIVIARSGYSTIMDLQALGKKAIFIPTPGQTEQEYLADRLETMQIAMCVYQEDIDLSENIKAIKDFRGFSVRISEKLLSNSIHNILALLKNLTQ